ncbi:MAG: ADP-ribosylation factor-like protein, partial [Promethearchaeota archaeon]
MYNRKMREISRKITILGLENAGKTSIMKTMFHEFKGFANLMPTKGIERSTFEFFGKSLSIWDFGGQELYREIYLTRPIMYFQGIKCIYYVIDAQDMERLPKSIDYFLKIFDLAVEYSENFQVYLFFHKIDPHYTGDVNFNKVEDDFLESTLPLMQNHNIHPNAFHTSIKDPISVISAFSQPLLGNRTIYTTLCDVIDTFCWNHDLPFANLFIDNFEIGSHYSSKVVYNYISGRIAKYLTWLEDTDDFEEFGLGDYSIITKPFEIDMGEEVFNFYFAVGIDEVFTPDDLDYLFDDIDEFVFDLRKVLQNSEIVRSGILRTAEIFSEEMREFQKNKLEKLDELEGLEENDKEKILQRDLELEELDSVYVNQREKEKEKE